MVPLSLSPSLPVLSVGGVRVVDSSSLTLHLSVGVSMDTLRLDGPGSGTGSGPGLLLGS